MGNVKAFDLDSEDEDEKANFSADFLEESIASDPVSPISGRSPANTRPNLTGAGPSLPSLPLLSRTPSHVTVPFENEDGAKLAPSIASGCSVSDYQGDGFSSDVSTISSHLSKGRMVHLRFPDSSGGLAQWRAIDTVCIKAVANCKAHLPNEAFVDPSRTVCLDAYLQHKKASSFAALSPTTSPSAAHKPTSESLERRHAAPRQINPSTSNPSIVSEKRSTSLMPGSSLRTVDSPEVAWAEAVHATEASADAASFSVAVQPRSLGGGSSNAMRRNHPSIPTSDAAQKATPASQPAQFAQINRPPPHSISSPKMANATLELLSSTMALASASLLQPNGVSL
ncbi:MAG: hypothetical protein SGPRY_011278 [Prymnesium sp.]